MIVDVLDTRCFCQSILLTVDVLGQKIDVFVIDVLKIDVLEIVQMGRPGYNLMVTLIIIMTLETHAFR